MIQHSDQETKKALQRREKEEEQFLQNIVNETSRATAPDEQTFSQNVQIGELLAAQGPEQHLQAAAAFFKALKAYPSPMELLMIYQQAVPQEVMAYIRKMVSLDQGLSAASQGSTRAADLASQASANIEEIDDEGPKGSTAGVAIAQEDPAPSVSSQEWEKVSPAEDAEQKAQQATEASAVPASEAAAKSVSETATAGSTTPEDVISEQSSQAPPS
ncbi:uncharacterized protein FA14DRAFT_162193 [Meira miltonrushii]|uniref:Protein import receptor MAS20 n=1 Tax=Meira miltonrushii TaxID=1280837 RepID=A0A316V765_9BASI|nr:uncharacterized protein FA14DRAFT_162193 [Meira miltonrushii]PWN33034.1 hypothetical protein FA14DRAFT_162193 [Meira miltonrushii]